MAKNVLIAYFSHAGENWMDGRLRYVEKGPTRRVAETFDFSGGQIENIARKYSINGILHGNVKEPLEILTNYCSEERIQNQTGRKIGFYVIILKNTLPSSSTKRL